MTTNTNNNMSTSNQTMAISFRNKFKKLLTEDNYETTASAFQQFCDSFTPEVAIKYLWNMTYLQGDINLEEDELFWFFPKENIIALRNELRFQYELRNPGFLDVQVSDECQEAFETLAKRTDAITAKVVLEHCKNYSYLDESSIERTLYLLSSDLENNVYGGIRCLAFDREAASYLQSFHMQIHDLLKALHDARRKEYASYGSNPFAELASMVDKASAESMEDKRPASPKPACDMPKSNPKDSGDASETEDKLRIVVTKNSGFKELTTAQILKEEACFKEVIGIDMSILRTLRDSGFDLNEIVDKADKIRTLLMAADELNEPA